MARMKCIYCSGSGAEYLETKLDKYHLELFIKDELLYFKLGVGFLGLTKPIQIKFCPWCGRELAEEKKNGI